MSTRQSGEVDALLDSTVRFARSQATGERARGDEPRERAWLDLLINLDRLRTLSDRGGVVSVPADPTPNLTAAEQAQVAAAVERIGLAVTSKAAVTWGMPLLDILQTEGHTHDCDAVLSENLSACDCWWARVRTAADGLSMIATTADAQLEGETGADLPALLERILADRLAHRDGSLAAMLLTELLDDPEVVEAVVDVLGLSIAAERDAQRVFAALRRVVAERAGGEQA